MAYKKTQYETDGHFTERPPIIVTQRVIIATIEEGPNDSGLNMIEAAFVAIARQDDEGCYDFEVHNDFGPSFTYTIDVGRRETNNDGR